MNTKAFSVLLNRIKAFVFFTGIAIVISACTQGSSTVTTQQPDGGGIVVPKALHGLSADNALTAYIRVDEGERQQMVIDDGNAFISLTGISQGSHTFTVKFEYISSSAPGNPIILASASKMIDVKPGDNPLSFLEADYETDSFDEDGDGVSNLDEILNGSNPFASITISAISGNTAEDGTTALFTVVLTSAPTDDVSIAISSSDASEGSVDQDNITFSADNWSTPQTITVTGIDDDLVDGDSDYTIVISAATSQDTDYNALDPADINLVNTDDDTAGFMVSALSGNTTETGVSVTFTLALTSMPSADVSIDASSSDTSEGMIDTPTITFTSNNWSTPQTITVTGINDDLVDGNQSYVIQFTAATSADSLYDGQNLVDVQVVNVDDDSAAFNISPINGDTSEDGTTATFSAQLTTQPTANVTIDVTSSDTSEGTVSHASIVFHSDNWNTTQIITVTGVDDAVDDGDQSYAINLAAATSMDADYAGLIPGNITVTNVDDDNAGFMISLISGDTAESGTTASFTIALSSAPTASVTLAISSSDVNENTVSPSSITFDSSNWNVAQTITVTGVDDAVDDGNQTSSILLAAATSTDPGYNGRKPADVMVINTDDDGQPTVTLSIDNASLAEAGGVATLTATLTGASAQNIVVSLGYSGTSTHGNDYSASNSISIPAGETTGTAPINVIQDSLDEDNESIVVDINSVTNGIESGTQQVNASIIDDDQQPSVTLSINTASPLAEAAGTANLTATLSEVSGRPVTVNLTYTGTATAGTDYSKSDAIIIPAGNTFAQITLTAIDDALDEINETIVVDISTVSNGVEITTEQVTASITDDDIPLVTFTTADQSVTESEGTVTLTASADQAPASDISVTFAVTGTAAVGIDHDLVNGEIIIPTGQITGTTSFSVQNDNVVEANETIIVTLNNPVNAILGAAIIHTVTITDNDSPGFIVSPISGNTTEEGSTATFNVALLSLPTADVTIGVSSSDETEGMVDKTSITFSTSNWNMAQTITVTGLDDGNVDGDQNYAIILAAATSSDSNYNDLKPNDVTLTNIDRNLPPSASSVSIIDDNAESTVMGDSLTGSYTFADANGDVEGTSTYRWLRNNAAIGGAQALTYTLVAADSGQIITFEVTPVAATGISTGTAVTSDGITVDLNAAVLSLDFGIKQLQFGWPAVQNATYYRLMENPDGVSGFVQRGANITTTSSTLDIAVHRQDWGNARYLLQACNSNFCSSSSEVSTLGGVLSAIGYIKASNAGETDEFGTSVALSSDGNTLAVGAYQESSNATGISTDGTGEEDNSANWAGAAYVFSRSGNGWVQQAYVKASNAGETDEFGTSVALSSDGNTLVVGAPRESSNATGISTDGIGEEDNSATNAGAVYVFGRNGDSWSQQAYIKASNAERSDWFGGSVALSSDGNTLVVGAHRERSNATGISTDGTGEADNSAVVAGAVYVFGRSGGSWIQQAYVKASNAEGGDWFGTSVALSGDSNTLAVGAWGESSNGTGEADNSAVNAGAVYVFSRSSGSWVQQAYVKASNAEADDEFGGSVALSSDGNTLVVGASDEDSSAIGINIDGSGEADNSASKAGAVYVFGRNGGDWSQQAYAKASNAEAGDRFGTSVALSGDGNTLVVGAWAERSNATGVSTDGTGEEDNSAFLAGAVYVFGRSSSSWLQQTYVKASNAGVRDWLGISVSVNSDGNIMAAGAASEDSNAIGITHGADAVGANNSAPSAGAVYLY